MQIFVQTRGVARASDYSFLGRAPDSPWWRSYRDQTTFDHPTLIVQSDGTQWRAYLSGIPSGRVDSVGTVVRYTVALEGACGNADVADNRHALGVIAAWLGDIATRTPGGGVQSAFDREFPSDVVERLVSGRDDVWPEAQRRAMVAVRSLPAVHPVTDAGPRSWIGNIDAPAPRAEFLGRASGLVAGAPGRALFLNLIGSREDGAALAQDDLPIAILGEDITGIPTESVAELRPKKAPPPPRVTHQVAIPTTPRRPSLLRWLATMLSGARRWFR